MSYSKMQTYWDVNSDGDLITVGSGDPAWRTVFRPSMDFPLTAETVARMLREAFIMGADAKQSEIKATLGLGRA